MADRTRDTTIQDIESFYSDFQHVSDDSWKELAVKQLKKNDFEAVFQVIEDIKVKPIYQQSDLTGFSDHITFPGFIPFIRGYLPLSSSSKLVEYSQKYFSPTPKRLNEALKMDLKEAIDSVIISFDEATVKGKDADNSGIGQVGKNGLSLSSVADLFVSFKDIDINNFKIPFAFDTIKYYAIAILLILLVTFSTIFGI